MYIDMKRKISGVITGTLMLSGIALFSACSGKSETNTEEVAEKALVKTALVAEEQVEQLATFSASIEAFEKAYISSAQPVRIERIMKEVGDYVRKNDVLVQMDASNFRQAQTQLEMLEKEYARMDTLYAVGSVSLQQLDQLKSQLDVARNSYANLVENTQLRSPISGIVTGRFYEDGEMFSMTPVANGRSAILTVEVIDPVKVTVNMGEQYFPRIDKDIEVSLALDVYSGKTFEGSVHIKYPTIDVNTRTFTVEMTFPNQEGLIRPGMFGRVTLVFGELERVVVPDLAVVRQQGINENYVFVVENGRAVRRTIKTGRLIGNHYEVIEGLNGGEEVVVAGQSRLLDGTEVEVQK
ncbi:probable Co/Zn/Cd efflux system membrane fusion protein [Geofilum rubicundum JCM 15548]|uniref:Probable Co/Zn/Cd efflux system membrane fusion protein n=2 Tax=Geofilum TaxID=1236988 RepID=A0A0E9M0L1_9BACT|nr:probable Co/Zn/Cd efflux system membrane fusion protein [Geofilum rubicundum JCM 15548]